MPRHTSVVCSSEIRTEDVENVDHTVIEGVPAALHKAYNQSGLQLMAVLFNRTTFHDAVKWEPVALGKAACELSLSL